MNYGGRQHMPDVDPEVMRRAVLVAYARKIGAWDVDVEGHISTEELRDRVQIELARRAGREYRAR